MKKRKDYVDKIGICSNCGEMTSVLEPCCDAPILFEGSQISIDEFEDEEE
jgi:hypothetical protein